MSDIDGWLEAAYEERFELYDEPDFGLDEEMMADDEA